MGEAAMRSRDSTLLSFDFTASAMRMSAAVNAVHEVEGSI